MFGSIAGWLAQAGLCSVLLQDGRPRLACVLVVLQDGWPRLACVR